MFANKVEKSKQFLKIEIQESQDSHLQQHGNIDSLYERNKSNENDEDIESENYSHSNEQSQQQDGSISNSEGSQQNSYPLQTFNKYKSINDENYLIQQEDQNRSSKNYQNKGNQNCKNYIEKSYQPHHLQQSKRQDEKDFQVQKIINDVLYKRQHQQKQKHLLQSIINSQKNNYLTQNLPNFTKQMKIKPNSMSKNTTKKQKSLHNYYQTMKKCKQLQTKINKMVKKQTLSQKQKQNKQKQLEKQKKSINDMSERQKSLQKLKKRLQKALNLNQNLSKRVKLQKSQLNSIFMESRSQIEKHSINQESTIKSVQNPSLMIKNKQKYSAVQNTFRSSPEQSEVYLSKIVQKTKNDDKINKKSQKGKQLIQKQNGKDISTNKNTQNINYNKQKSSLSPAKYKSPILQFNSYLIDQSQYISPSINYNKQNIYIQDDSVSQKEPQSQIMQNHKFKTSQFMIQELKNLMEKYLTLEIEQKSLQEKIEMNSGKIKQYETRHYHQVVESL